MSSIILEAKSLTKEYKQTLALDHINLQIKKGKIYGFIGQNGAGKTTFLRLVSGLAFPTSGTLSLWGNSGTEELQKQRKRIGSMIETPALFPSMTAYQNTEVQRIQRGIPDKSVIKRTLDMVGLQDTGKKSVRNFSLGMRQRLGIAIALLNTPELLILDEPINGLDPAGIVEIRNLLKILNKEYGMTILVSSHILEELYQTASEFILIDHGKIIEEISDYELNERCKRHIAIKTTDVQKTVLVLEENLHTDNFKLMPDGIIRLYDYLNDLETVALILGQEFSKRTINLEVSAGHSRKQIFTSKIISYLIAFNLMALVYPVSGCIREFGRFGVADVGMFFYNIIKAIIYSCLLNSAIFLIAILICCYLQDAVKATSVTAIIIFGLSLYLGYGMMLRLPVGFLPTYQIRIVVSMKTFFQPIAILVGCIWSGILVLLSWIKFCKCDFK